MGTWSGCPCFETKRLSLDFFKSMTQCQPQQFAAAGSAYTLPMPKAGANIESAMQTI